MKPTYSVLDAVNMPDIRSNVGMVCCFGNTPEEMRQAWEARNFRILDSIDTSGKVNQCFRSGAKEFYYCMPVCNSRNKELHEEFLRGGITVVSGDEEFEFADYLNMDWVNKVYQKAEKHEPLDDIHDINSRWILSKHKHRRALIIAYNYVNNTINAGGEIYTLEQLAKHWLRENGTPLYKREGVEK